MNKKLSIIVPVYNGEKYIAECLTTLAPQLGSDAEIILINDGSTDGTDRIVKNGFQEQIGQGQIKYITTRNAGVSAARNLALDNATGDYISFVDADDMVSSDYVHQICLAVKEGPCIIELGYRTTDDDGKILDDNQFLHRRFGMHPAAEVIDDVFASCIWYPFLRVFKRDMLKEVRFPVGVKFCEDMITFSETYFLASKIFSLPLTLYEYRINPSGATRNIKPEHGEPLIQFYRKIIGKTGFPVDALKVAVAYAIRRCNATTKNRFGPLPNDIAINVIRVSLNPRIALKVGFQFTVGAVAGPAIDLLKRIYK
jgi:glycosyltransferase involved in cell wall biosynthesis